MMQRAFPFLAACVALFGSAVSAAEVQVLHPVADTTLIELVPDNNMGGHVFFNAGTTLNGKRNRGLLRFDIANSLPKGAQILSAELVLEVVGIPTDEPAGSNFRLHRLLHSWGEGDKVSGVTGPGRGDVATAGEATWNHRFAFSTNTWLQAGGQSGTDYVPEFSAEQFVDVENNQQYTFTSTPQLVADIQLWLDFPAENHGWLLKTEIEEYITTARRFASREDEDYAPSLLIEYEAPPRLFISREGSDLMLSFNAKAGVSYTLQHSDLSASWQNSTVVPAAEARTVTLTNSIVEEASFYRLQASE